MSIPEAIREALAQERVATAARIWRKIEKAASAPDKLTDPIRLSWLSLLRIFDEERKP